MKSTGSKTFRKKLGKRIRQFRKEQKISQSQLAYESGISREEMYRMELGQQNVSVDILYSVAKALDVQVKEFFDFK